MAAPTGTAGAIGAAGAAAAARVLGVDLGGTKVALRAEGAGGRAEEVVLRWPGSGGVAADWAALTSNVRSLEGRWGGGFDAVGVAVPATLDPAGTVWAWPGRPAWTGFGLGAALRELFPGAAVRQADDGDLAALAEAVHAGYADVAYLGVGTGVGGGLVRAGRLFPGPERGSCEVGHMLVDRGGPPCDCGRRGCLQATASGPATLGRAAELRRSATDFAELRDALAAGADWAVRAVDDTCAALAAGVVTLAEIAHPDVALIGGGFAAGIPSFTARVDTHVRRLARAGFVPPPVVPATLGALSSLYGAVALAREALPAAPAGREAGPTGREALPAGSADRQVPPASPAPLTEAPPAGPARRVRAASVPHRTHAPSDLSERDVL
ncbi:ROK family protein [Actinacidiphila paucisporea]|uniref:Kanosamine 6-kinase n=1 Tax=Actinacidiphila paucisporea TaxID=310782 RepID=A0A1M7LYB0_9ACTN|nr:ROK family protein [Actinacidiphila paucisporea]SHM83355.1 kanosamine 6-kinase [Actinacidiphila paucisporea]